VEVSALDLSEIHQAIRARHLCIPFDRVLTVSPDDNAAAAAHELAAVGYDNAPVLDDGDVVGVFSREGWFVGAGTVEKAMHRRQLQQVVTADTTYRQLLKELQEQPLLLVLNGRTVLGIVTPGDTGSAPGRTHFYLLLSGLEMAIAEWVRRLYPEQDSALSHLTEDRSAKIEALYDQLRDQDDHLDLVAAMSLHDLIKILKCTPHARAAVEFGELRLNHFDSLDSFRNDVMHPVREFTHATTQGLARLQRWDDRLSALLARVQGALAS